MLLIVDRFQNIRQLSTRRELLLMIGKMLEPCEFTTTLHEDSLIAG
jgi:hypothetical protein